MCYETVHVRVDVVSWGHLVCSKVATTLLARAVAHITMAKLSLLIIK